MSQSDCGVEGSKEPSLELSGSINAFSFKLYRDLLRKNAEENVFFSPFSIYYAMLMLFLGCEGESKTELVKALFLGRIEEVHFFAKELRNSLLTPSEGVVLLTANRLFPEASYHVKKEFLANVKEYYDSEVFKLDFKSNSEDSRRAINEWVSETTKLKIQDLMPEGTISSNTRLVLANAVYFKANWENQFEKSNTMKHDFHVSPEKMVKVDLMMRKAKYRCAVDDKARFYLLELPYVNTMSMMIALPIDRFGLAKMEKEIDSSKLLKMEKLFEKEEIVLGLPKMKLEFENDLVDSFKVIGATSIFSQDANLTGISETRDLAVSAVSHKACIEVTEEGAEAAAATGVVASRMALLPPTEFICDHPFLFFIKHKETNTILFTGRLVNP